MPGIQREFRLAFFLNQMLNFAFKFWTQLILHLLFAPDNGVNVGRAQSTDFWHLTPVGKPGSHPNKYHPTKENISHSINSWSAQCSFSFAQWHYRSQWGSPEARLLLIENFSQYPARRLEIQSALQFLAARTRAHAKIYDKRGLTQIVCEETLTLQRPETTWDLFGFS